MATSNRIRALNRLPFDFQDGLKVNGVDFSDIPAKLQSMQAGTISELIQINVEKLNTSSQILVKEYHVGSGIGGGVFFWDAFRKKSEHNGGTVIDPARQFPVTLTDDLSLTNWYGFISSIEYGAFVRVDTNDDFKVNEFGAVPNSPAHGGLNWFAVKRCISSAVDYRYKRNNGYDADSVDLRTNGKVVFGKGYYVFNYTNPLRPELSEDIPTWYNSKRRGLTIVGAGLDQTILYNSGQSGQDFYFWENYNTSVDQTGRLRHGYDLVQFKDISFHGPFSDNSARNYGVSHPRPIGSKVNGFGIYSSGWDKYFSFHEVGFSGIDTVIDVTGTSNGDSMSFFRCVFAPIRETVFRCTNDQSVGNSFTECIYTLFGDFITVGAGGGGGSQIRGGSFVMYPQFEDDGTSSVVQGQRALVNANFTASPSARGSYYSFSGVSFEFYHPNQKDVQINSSVIEGSYRILFDDCDWNTTMYWNGSAVTVPVNESPSVVINGRSFGNVTYRKCLLHWSRAFEITNNALSNSYIGVPCIELVDNTCNWAVTETIGNYGLISNKIKIVGGGALVNISGTVYPLINSNQDQGRNYCSDYKGVLGIGSVWTEGKVVSAMLKYPGHPWGKEATANKLFIPKYAKILRIKLYRAATTNPNNFTVTLTNGLSGENKVVYATWTQPENQLLDINSSILITTHNGLLAVENTAGNLEGMAGFAIVDYS